jgi:hypothetical protein
VRPVTASAQAASYWLDLRGYRPVEVAAALGKPILILQGGPDYQATVAEDLAGWESATEEVVHLSMRWGASWCTMGFHHPVGRE